MSASMRPRRIRRGMPLRPAIRRGSATSRSAMRVEGFNEAPANSPGNAWAAGTTSAIPPGQGIGFNEAPANSPGNAAFR